MPASPHPLDRIPETEYNLRDYEQLARAREIGGNIMKSLNTPAAERTWLGEPDAGWCPNCHSNCLCLGEPQWRGLCSQTAAQLFACGHRSLPS